MALHNSFFCRALQQASQAHIVVDQNYPEGEPRKVNISGRVDSVERASKMVEELITGEPGSAQAIIQKVLASPPQGFRVLVSKKPSLKKNYIRLSLSGTSRSQLDSPAWRKNPSSPS
jgi:hypothetical protein